MGRKLRPGSVAGSRGPADNLRLPAGYQRYFLYLSLYWQTHGYCRRHLGLELSSEGAARTILHSESGKKRVLINIEAGCTYRATPDEVFVVAGTYCDPSRGKRPPLLGRHLPLLPTRHRASAPAGP